MKKEIDYKKPFYINSFGADEIIFNMIRGTHIKTCKYDGSLPVSLDSLKILKICNSNKKRIPYAFYKTGRDEQQKSFCDAVINVNFSKDPDFSDIEIIKIDHNDRLNGNVINCGDMLYPPKIYYPEFLDAYQENQKLWNDKNRNKDSKIELQMPDNFRIGDGFTVLSDIKISADGTVIKVKSRMVNRISERSSIDLILYLCKKNDDGSYEVLGAFNYDDVTIGANKTKTVRAEIDLKSIANADEEKKMYIINKGQYQLFVGDINRQIQVAVLDLKEDIESYTLSLPSEWVDVIDRPPFLDESESLSELPVVEINTDIQRTYKKCANIFQSIMESGIDGLMTQNGLDLSRGGVKLKSREILYSCGFDFEGKDGQKRHYVVYKRSASKSKTGNCLFIWDELYEEMKQWTWMDRYFDEKKPGRQYDLTSIKAYEALTLSNIETTFKLDKKNILMIDAMEGLNIKGNRRIICNKKGEFEINTPVECLKCENVECRKKTLESGNNIWDGQALLDESVFAEVFPDEMHGMMLLRNRFFKACAFNTRITEYFNKNGIETVYDMFGQRRDAGNIKLIFTPDSLKYLKFSKELFSSKDKNEKNADCRKEAYNYWLANLKTCHFGVVKTDKPSRKNGMHKVGYQILNTLPLYEKEMEGLFQKEKERINRLWKDDDLFRKIIPKESAKGRFISRMCEMISDPDAEITEDFFQTDDYIRYKRQIIDDQKKRMRRGAIELEGHMLTLCSMPFEMLQYSGMTPGERKNKIKPLLGVDQAYIEGFTKGDKITLCRYPHLSSGSVCGLVNEPVAEYKEWFNLSNSKESSSIVVISPYESNIMVKLGGADFDSDTALFIKEPIVQAAAEQLNKKDGLLEPICDRFAPEADGLPVAQAGAVIKGEEKLYPLTPVSLARLDKSIADTQRNIGTISNDIQLFNSYLWEALKAERDSEYCQKIYECIMKLSVLNEFEIDRSKHSVNIDTKSIHSNIMSTEYNGKPILESPNSGVRKISIKKKEEKTTKEELYYNPVFLYEIRKDRGTRKVNLRKEKKYWDCPPDYLSKLAAKLHKPKSRYDKKKLVFVYKDVGGDVNGKQLEKIEDLLKTAVEALDKIDRRRHKTGDELEERLKIQKDFVNGMINLKIRPKNIANILNETMNRQDEQQEKRKNRYLYQNKFKYRIWGLLFMAEEKIEEKIEKEKNKKGNKNWTENPIRIVLQKIKVSDLESEEKK